MADVIQNLIEVRGWITVHGNDQEPYSEGSPPDPKLALACQQTDPRWNLFDNIALGVLNLLKQKKYRKEDLVERYLEQVDPSTLNPFLLTQLGRSVPTAFPHILAHERATSSPFPAHAFDFRSLPLG